MPIAYDPNKREGYRLDETGQWAKSQLSHNPQTGEIFVLDGQEWKPFKPAEPAAPAAAPAPDPDLSPPVNVNPPAPAAPPPPQSWGDYAQGLQEQVVQGIPFADEIRAAGRATGAQAAEALGVRPATETWMESYTRSKGDIDKGLEEFQTANPKASLAANVSGGLLAGPSEVLAAPVGAAQGAARAAASRLPATTPAWVRPLATNVGLGAASGAVAGAGAGGTAEDPIDMWGRARSAAAGGVAGAALGAAAPVAGAVVSGGWRAVRNMLGLQNVDKAAAQHMIRSFQREGATPDQAIDRIREMSARAGGAPVMPVDLGTQTQRLGRVVRTVPGAGSRQIEEALAGRQREAGGRVMGNVRRIVGSDRQNLTEEALRTARQTEAQPWYRQAFAQELPNDSPRLAQYEADPLIQQAMEEGRTIQRLEGLNDPTLDAAPSRMRNFDAAKRGLDQILERDYRNKITGRLDLDPLGRKINETRAEMLRVLDRLNPAYGRAREIWSGHSRSLDAINSGRDFMRGDVEDIERVLEGLSAGDRDFFMIGLSREMRDMINSPTSNLGDAAAKLASPKVQERLRPILGDRVDELNDMLGVEQQMKRTHHTATGGSQTGSVTAEQADAADIGPALSAVVDTATVGPTRAALNFASRSVSRAKGINEGTGEVLAHMLTRTSPEDLARLRGILNERYLRDLIRQRTTQRAGRGALVGSTSAITGTMEDRG